MFGYRHLLPRYFLNRQETTALEKRVVDFEKNTGCEIVFFFSRRLGKDPADKARKLFHKLGLHTTKYREGILIALGTLDRRIGIWADEGVVKQSDDALWKTVISKMAEELRQGRRLPALLKALETCEPLLMIEKKENDSADELPNKPLF